MGQGHIKKRKLFTLRRISPTCQSPAKRQRITPRRDAHPTFGLVRLRAERYVTRICLGGWCGQQLLSATSPGLSRLNRKSAAMLCT